MKKVETLKMTTWIYKDLHYNEWFEIIAKCSFDNSYYLETNAEIFMIYRKAINIATPNIYFNSGVKDYLKSDFLLFEDLVSIFLTGKIINKQFPRINFNEYNYIMGFGNMYFMNIKVSNESL